LMRLLVSPQASGIRESLLANWTRMGPFHSSQRVIFFINVHPLMDIQILFGSESPTTMSALNASSHATS
ncbi:hypothetical protein PMAYCL1PPCAC_08962, partial [Pristionchus mayeri]